MSALGRATDPASVPPGAAPAPPGDPGALQVPGIILQALAAVGTGIGVLGFVIFCGGAVIYVRLKSAGLPAVEGVARVPRDVLLATGAELLAPAALVTLGVVAILYCFDLWYKRNETKRLRAQRESVAQAERQFDAAVESQRTCEQQAEAARTEAAEAAKRMAAALKTPARSPEQAAEIDEGMKTAQEAVENVRLAGDLVAAAEQRLKHQRTEIQRRRALHEAARHRDSVSRTLLEAELLFLLAWIVVVLSSASLPVGQLVVLFLTALGTSLMAFAVFTSTQRFVWFGVAAFIAIGTVFGLTRFYETKNDPQVAPVAVLRAHHEPIAGFLVADTGDILMLGWSGGSSADRELVVMPRGEVHDLALGKVTDPTRATAAALGLLTDLCRQYTQDEGYATATHGTIPPRRQLCTRREQRQVASDLKAALQAQTPPRAHA